MNKLYLKTQPEISSIVNPIFPVSDEEEDTIPLSFSNLSQPNYHSFNINESIIKNYKLNNLSKLVSNRSQVN